MNIAIQIATPKHQDLPTKNFIKKVLQKAAEHPLLHSRSKKEILVRLVTPEEMQKLNAYYRKRDYATNVLAFPFVAPPGFEAAMLGDIIICHKILKTEARAQHKALADHYAHMLVHGLLHLLGYDHLKPKEAKTMENLEINILHTLNIDNPYEEHQ
jgi:probable rRNA maturation factor